MGNRNNHRRYGRRRENEQSQKKDVNVVFPECPMCSKPIREVHSAISSPDTGDPCHFDCVVKKLTEAEELKAEERICYLGNGTFGVIVPRASSGPVKFTIKKKIQYEQAEKKAGWRSQISGTITSITH